MSLWRFADAGDRQSNPPRKTAMKTIAENFAYNTPRARRSGEGSADNPLLAKIGDDLRDLYSEITEADQPRTLLDLAEAIDARRSGDGLDE